MICHLIVLFNAFFCSCTAAKRHTIDDAMDNKYDFAATVKKKKNYVRTQNKNAWKRINKWMNGTSGIGDTWCYFRNSWSVEWMWALKGQRHAFALALFLSLSRSLRRANNNWIKINSTHIFLIWSMFGCRYQMHEYANPKFEKQCTKLSCKCHDMPWQTIFFMSENVWTIDLNRFLNVYWKGSPFFNV